MTDHRQTILLVEDNEDDVFAMRRALRLARIGNPLQVVTDGEQALDYLSGANGFAERHKHPLPFIIFLDLKLPYVDGFEVLSWIRRQPALDNVIVVVLTSSAESRDQEKARALGARTYLIKPPTAESLSGIFDSLKSYWTARGLPAPVVKVPNGLR